MHRSPESPCALSAGLPAAAQQCSSRPASTVSTGTLGGAILSAALALPGIGAVHAETAPEHGAISLRYLDYEESQPGLTRVRAHSPSLMLLAPIAGEWSVEATLTRDDVSGATPRYHTAISGASKMEDTRNAGDLRVTRYFPHGTLAIGAAYSTENDYESRALSAQGSVSSEDKNTTWSFGIGGASDRINPVSKIVTDESKRSVDLMAGVTQVLTARDIAQVNLTYTRGRGYFSDPYKSLDNRPRERNQTALLARWNHHFAEAGGTSRLSYRYYSDSFDVKAHAFGAEYVQPLPGGWTVTPSARLYSQSAASFYYDPVYDKTLGAPFPPGFVFGGNQYLSADQRLSAFGARTLGIKLAKQLGDNWLLDVKLEAYEQRASWRMFGQGSPGLEPFRARSIQVGITRQW